MQIIYNKLWKILIDKNIKKSQLKKMSCISTSSLAKLGKNEPVTLEVLFKICEALDVNIGDIMEFVKNEN